MEPTAVITGASGGIGQAMVRMFAAAGYRVFCGCFSHPESLEALTAQLCSQGCRRRPSGRICPRPGRQTPLPKKFWAVAVDMSTCWSTMRA